MELVKLARSRFLQLFRRAPPGRVELSPEAYVDVNGLPGDTVPDILAIIETISKVLSDIQVPWFLAGDLLLSFYNVPQVTSELEIIVPSEELDRVQQAFDTQTEFCFPFRHPVSQYRRHLRPYPRFRVKGVRQTFSLAPIHLFGLHPSRINDVIYGEESKTKPFLLLPHYIQGLTTIILTKKVVTNNFACQLDFLIDALDLDEAWCDDHLDGRTRGFVRSISSRTAKKQRIGSTPKHEGNLTVHLRDETERQEAIRVPGRVVPTLNNSSPLQIMSDLHLELSFRVGEESKPGYEVFDTVPSSPVLALLGDIGNTVQDGLFIFLRRQLSKFQKVFFLMGNHEFYGATFDSAKSQVKHFSETITQERISETTLGEFVFLDQTRYDLTDQVTILGCTLWSLIPPEHSQTISLRLNDFKRIKEWTVEKHNAAHEADANWLEKTCAEIQEHEPSRRIIILTHFAPLKQGTSSPRHEGTTSSSSISSAFSTDMSSRSCWGYPVTHWVFGHTHFNCDFIHNGVRVVSNQRGYEGIETPRIDFHEDLILQLARS